MGHPKQLTYPSSLPEVYWGFAWTPDNKIVYVSSASGNQDIWMMDADASNPRQLTADAGRNFDPVVTPDGRSIVFASTRAGGISIWKMNIDGTNSTRLTYGDLDSLPTCSPDSRWVVYQAGPREDLDRLRLWKVSINGGEPVQLTDAYSTWPSVSPNGKWIACWYRQGSSMKAAVLPFNGGEPVKTFAIGPSVEILAELRWTPDGRAVTYIDNGGGVLNPWSQGVGNIWSQPLDGGSPKELTDFRENVISRFEWSRDGTRLVCARGNFANDIVLIRDFR
jgi:Tol biopolymer transport system component